MPGLSVSLTGHIALLEIRRGPANYFDRDLLREIADAGEELQRGPDARVIVLCSEGKHFCAGANFGAGPLEGADDRRIAVSVRPSSNRLALVSVADSGPGIPAHERSRVVERFVRLEASRNSPGTGLGLSLVAAVAHFPNAQLLLEDNGPGLKAILRFPRPALRLAPASPRTQQVPARTAAE